MKCSVYARTIEIFHDFMVKEKESIDFFLKVCYIFACFLVFVWSYKQMFPEIEKGDLINPLQVSAQVSSFLFFFWPPVKTARVKKLLFLCFMLCVVSSLHLKGIDEGVLFLVLLLSFIIKYLIPLEYAFLSLLLGYFLDQGLAEWGFYLNFQQFGYCALSFFLERGQSSAIPKKQIFSFIFLLIIQTFYGLAHFGDFYFAESLKLAALLSGASIVFLSSRRRTKFASLIAFALYFLLSILIGLGSASPDNKTTVVIPPGIIIFVLLHLLFFVGLY